MEEGKVKKYFIVYLRVLHGKEYVGKTSGFYSPDDLMKMRAGVNGNGYKGATRFYYAIQKYGWNNVKSKVLYFDLNEKQADMLETYEIIKRNTTNPKYGYNMTRGDGFMVDKELMEDLLKVNDYKSIKELIGDLDDEPKFRNTHDTNYGFVKMCKDKNIQGKKRIREQMKKYGVVESSFSHYTNEISGGRRYDPEFHELWTMKEIDCEGNIEPLF